MLPWISTMEGAINSGTYSAFINGSSFNGFGSMSGGLGNGSGNGSGEGRDYSNIIDSIYYDPANHSYGCGFNYESGCGYGRGSGDGDGTNGYSKNYKNKSRDGFGEIESWKG